MREETALEHIEMVLAEIYRGRTFVLPEVELTPTEMFSRYGGLSMVVASAAQTFRILYPNGIPVDRCMECGSSRLPASGSCPPSCPLAAGVKTLEWPFRLEWVPQANLADHLLPLRARLSPSRPAVMMAHFHLLDAMQEVVRAGETPRQIDCQSLLDSFTVTAQQMLSQQQAPVAMPAAKPQLDQRMHHHG